MAQYCPYYKKASGLSLFISRCVLYGEVDGMVKDMDRDRDKDKDKDICFVFLPGYWVCC